MDDSILADLAGTVRRHPWWTARASLTLALLEREGVKPPSRVLDAGCGWGVTLDALERRGYRAAGLDLSRRALEQIDRPDRVLFEADLTRDLDAALDGQPFDAVLALDVLEHLDDDRDALARIAGLVPIGGCVLISVPALPALFSEFDAVQGHRRRYTPETLCKAFDGTGLNLQSIRWWGSCAAVAIEPARNPVKLPPKRTGGIWPCPPGPAPGCFDWPSGSNNQLP